MAAEIWVNIDSSYGLFRNQESGIFYLLPDGTKPLPEPVLNYD